MAHDGYRRVPDWGSILKVDGMDYRNHMSSESEAATDFSSHGMFGLGRRHQRITLNLTIGIL